ncbi:major facilitator superfamily protein [Klebsiella aerogenes]|nr:major facilitator superfamily protein [Klebsiella aerogenes]
MPVSLLTPIAGDLHITEGLAGQGIALSGALAVLTSLTISRLTGSLDRKWLLLGLTALMAASGVIIALASSFPVYMLGRALIGIVIGGFWSMSAATAIRLVPQRQVPRALAIFNGGNALATVVAAPLGSYLGATVGWRGAFLCLVPLAVLAFVWQCISLPSMKSPRAPQRQGSVLRLFRLSTLSLGLLACGLFFMGQFTLFTYVRPFLETVTQVSPSGLSLILLTMGIAGFIGTLLITTVSECPILSDAGGYPVVNGRNCRNASAGRTPHGIGRRTVKPVGAAGDGGAHRLVDMDCADAARGCGDGRRADGRRDPAIDSPRVNGRRPGV